MFWASKRLPLFRATSIFISPSYLFNRTIIHNLERVHSRNLAARYCGLTQGMSCQGSAHWLGWVRAAQTALRGMCVCLIVWEFFVLFYILIEKLIKILQKLKFKGKVSKISKIEYCNFHMILFEVDFQKMPSPSQISIQSMAITDIQKI